MESTDDPSSGSEVLPFGGSIMAAMRAGDRAAIRTLMAARDRDARDKPVLLAPPSSARSPSMAATPHGPGLSPIGGGMMGGVGVGGSSTLDTSMALTTASRSGLTEPEISYGAPFPYPVTTHCTRTSSCG
jgi:hypothetical protein